ncbi:efflux RND transporter permease subunit [Photobacterium sp. TY1-4]|uniref:efflux RND transporter permease subunit n=1 Tax=Photobacterium sp. TY1-4 TaxID=2899122 RepID=UPI0021BF811C|nr:efflux RND transporter permease subunit [Photobacterium sp. TY1-4]UXI03582.1 efflux RND transporter permease subunit [Photobacterium sp. TY1-4]
MNGLTRWFIDHPIAANLLMVAILAAGLLTAGQLRVESFPQMAPSSLVIEVAYPGGTARQIDQSITQRVEEAVSGLAGIKQITSQSSAGLATIRVRKTAATDLDHLLEDVRDQINSIESWPALAEKPIIRRDAFTNLAAFVVISGARPDRELQPIARQVELALKQHPDISNVSNWGARAPQLIIEPDIDKLRHYGLNLESLAGILEQMSLETRSGELKRSSGRLVLRGDGYADDLSRLSGLEVLSTAAGTLTLGELATLRRGYETTGAIVRNNGDNAIALLISTSQQDNLLRISQAIENTLARQRQRQRLPADITLSTMADMAPYIEDQLDRLTTNAWQGLLIVLLLLGLFLDLKLAFWVALGIPVALCGTLGAMNGLDYSINDITLFGFILVLGILVDDAVVVGESIHARQHPHRPPKEAAWQGVHAVSVATVFGVLTTIVAFSPMLWLNNDFGRLFASFSAIVIIALLFSLIESKWILPAHLAGASVQLRLPSFVTRTQQSAQQLLERFIQAIYRPLLQRALHHKLATLLSFSAVVVLAYGLWANGTIRSALFPEIPGRYITAKVTLQQGAPIPLQEKALAQLERTALQLSQQLTQEFSLASPPLTNLLAWSDGYGDIEVTAELSAEALRQLPGNQLLHDWCTFTGPIEGADSLRFSAADAPAGGTLLSVSAPDRALAQQAATALAEQLTRLAGVDDVYDDGNGGQDQLRIRLNAFGRQLGLTQHHIAKLTGEAFGQRELHRILDHGRETQIILRYPIESKRSLAQLRQTPVILDNGQAVLLEDVATFTVEREPEVLYRRNREQVINLYWRQDRTIQSPEQTLQQLDAEIQAIESRFPGVRIHAAGEFEEISDIQQGLTSAFILTILLIYILLAIPLQSYWQPLLIMAVIPFGVAGAILGHGLMGLPISLLSMLGMMAMTGIVVNDSLVLLTQFNANVRSGMTLHAALSEACTGRFRAIFLTTITTVCGLLPLLSESAEQAQYLKPAAVSLVFGELLATAITLILTPVLLACFSRSQAPQKAPQKAASSPIAQESTPYPIAAAEVAAPETEAEAPEPTASQARTPDSSVRSEP